MFNWSENFETHIELIDTQHKKLVSILNDLCVAVNDHEINSETLENILKQLLDYTDYHFADEEQLMTEAGISEKHALVHKMEHRSFIYDVKRMGNYFLSSDIEVVKNGEKLVEFITAWLTYHILGIDKVLVAQINDIKQGMDAEKAYQKNLKGEYNKATMHLLLDAVLKMWKHSNEHCQQLEQQLAQCLAEKSKF